MNGILQFETNVYCLFHFSVFQRLSVFLSVFWFRPRLRFRLGSLRSGLGGGAVRTTVLSLLFSLSLSTYLSSISLFLPILLLLPFRTLSEAEVPLAPASVDLLPLSPESIRVDFTPPSSDRGSEITSYLIEWDTDPGVREVQEVRTRSYIGANEVQEISTSIPAVNEVQTISTTADVLPAIQSVTTSANPGSVLNSEFTLELDLTSIVERRQVCAPTRT